jgi:hypothetical protein
MAMMLTPEQLAKAGSEHSHQVALFQWIAITGCKQHPVLRRLFAIPNGGDRKPSVAAAMKAEGVKPGVPDMCLPIARRGFHSLWIELKRPIYATHKNGGCSEAQMEWHEVLRNEGHSVVVAYGWEGAVAALLDYLG